MTKGNYLVCANLACADWLVVYEQGEFTRCVACGEKLELMDATLHSQLQALGRPQKKKDAPVFGKQYMLTSAPGTPSVLNGNSWAESEVKPMHRCVGDCHDPDTEYKKLVDKKLLKY